MFRKTLKLSYKSGAPKIAKPVSDFNNYGLWMFMALVTIVTGVYKPSYNWGHHPVYHLVI